MKLSAAILQPAPGSHAVRVIKAADAAALLPPEKKEHVHAGPRKPSEVRLVATGTDYCDLEFICGCGEVTRFRCWNAPAEGKAS
jgi:hypothetical protein